MMALSAGQGPMMMVRVDFLSADGCVDAAASSGGDGVVSVRAAAGRTTTIASIGMRYGRLGCSAAETEAVSSSYSTSSRLQRMMITRSSRISGRQEVLRSRQQSDAVVGSAMTGEEKEEVMGSFWDRLQLAWRVLIGAPNEALATKNRFSRLLVRDRGFDSANLSRLYNAAKGAIKEHVELEGDENTEVAAVVDRLGELRLNFRVKRVRSVLRDEPFSDSVLPELEPSLSIIGDQLWEDRRAPHDSDVRVGVPVDERLPNSALPDVEPSRSISGDQLWEYSRAPLDLKARAGVALDRPVPDSVVLDREPLVSTSGGQLCEDNRASQDLEVSVRGASNLKSTTVGEALDELRKSVLLDEELNLSISGDQLWKDRKASSQGPEDQGPSYLKSSAVAGALKEPFFNSTLPDKVHVRDASYLLSTTNVDSEGEWYTFSFPDANQGEFDNRL